MAYKAHNPLPTPASDDAFIDIAPFETCSFGFPASMAIKGVRGLIHATSWRFFIRHKPSNTSLWFDLGVAHVRNSQVARPYEDSEPRIDNRRMKDLTLYPPRIQHVQHKVFNTVPGKTNPVQDMEEVGADPKDVKYIIASHAHWDHMFPAGAFFPHAQVLCGAGTLSWANPCWPTAPDSTFDGRIWDPERAEIPISELPSPSAEPSRWAPLGPFEHAHDFFGDGSFWLVDAPGHCIGNLAGLARVKTRQGKTKWAFLGGDCFHCVLFAHYPDAPFGKGVQVTSTDSYHEDEDGARDFIRRTAELKKGEGSDVWIWIAHTDVLEGVWEL